MPILPEKMCFLHVVEANRLYTFAFDVAVFCIRHNIPFCLENPLRSLVWPLFASIAVASDEEGGGPAAEDLRLSKLESTPKTLKLLRAPPFSKIDSMVAASSHFLYIRYSELLASPDGSRPSRPRHPEPWLRN